MKIVICSGGTGGHLFPALSLAKHLVSVNKNNKLKVYFFTDKRSLVYINSLPKNIKLKLINSKQFIGKNFVSKIQSLISIAFGILGVLWKFLFNRPQVIVAFGGYVSVPVLAVASILKIPFILHEQNSILGNANKLFANKAKFIITTFANTKGTEKYSNKTKWLGLPIRDKIIKHIDSNVVKQSDRYVVLIMGGSQGATVFGNVMPKAFSLFPNNIKSNLQVYHQCKKELAKEVQKEWQKNNIKATVQPFFNNIATLMLQSSIIITRAGASTISEINALGKPAIYIPFKKAVMNHQELNASVMCNSGCSKILLEDNLTSNNLFNIVSELIQNRAILKDMGKRAKQQYKNNSVKELATLIKQVANKNEF